MNKLAIHLLTILLACSTTLTHTNSRGSSSQVEYAVLALFVASVGTGCYYWGKSNARQEERQRHQQELLEREQQDVQQAAEQKRIDDRHVMHVREFIEKYKNAMAGGTLIEKINGSNGNLARIAGFEQLAQQFQYGLDQAEAHDNCDEACKKTRESFFALMERIRSDKAYRQAQQKEELDRLIVEEQKAIVDLKREYAAQARTQREHTQETVAWSKREQVRVEEAHKSALRTQTAWQKEQRAIRTDVQRELQAIRSDQGVRLEKLYEQLATQNEWHATRSADERKIHQQLARVMPVIVRLEGQAAELAEVSKQLQVQLRNRLSGLPQAISQQLQVTLNSHTSAILQAVANHHSAQQKAASSVRASQTKQRPEHEVARPPAFSPDYVAQPSAPPMGEKANY